MKIQDIMGAVIALDNTIPNGIRRDMLSIDGLRFRVVLCFARRAFDAFVADNGFVVQDLSEGRGNYLCGVRFRVTDDADAPDYAIQFEPIRKRNRENA